MKIRVQGGRRARTYRSTARCWDKDRRALSDTRGRGTGDTGLPEAAGLARSRRNPGAAAAGGCSWERLPSPRCSLRATDRLCTGLLVHDPDWQRAPSPPNDFAVGIQRCPAIAAAREAQLLTLGHVCRDPGRRDPEGGLPAAPWLLRS